jgi:MFS family permease
MKSFFDKARQNGVINPWVIAITVMLATFMEVLDTSVANVALPHIAGDLSAGVDESTWVLTSYLVYRFVKRYSHRPAFLICFAAWQGNRGVRSWC